MTVFNFDQVLNNLLGRVYALEQYVYGTNENNFADIVIDDGTNPPVVITPAPPGIPTGLTATPGSFYDVVYADIAWTPAVGGEPAYVYEIEVAKKVAGVYQTAFIERTAGTNFRIQPLEPNTTYGVRVTAYSILGVHDAATAWVDFNSGIDTTIPVAPSNVVIARGATSVIVKFDPSTSADVIGGAGYYQIEIDTSTAFNTANKRSSNSASTVFAFSDITSQGTWYARVAAVDSSGNQSAWVTSTAYTAGAIIDNMIVAGLDAAKITFGSMSGDRITANTMDVNTLKTSTLTSANITLNGGLFQAGSPPTTGLLINSQGIRLYNAGAVVVSLDVLGSASFSGNISASSISGGSITGTTISGGTITGGSISGGTISGASVSGGTISGGAISGGTITGATITGSTIVSANFQTDTGIGSGHIARVRMGAALTAQDEVQFIGPSGGIASIRHGESVSGGFSVAMRLSAGGIIDILANLSGNTVQLTGGTNVGAGIILNGRTTMQNGAVTMANGNVTVSTGGALSSQSLTTGGIVCTNVDASGSGDFTSLYSNMPSGSGADICVSLSTRQIMVGTSTLRIKHSVEDLHVEVPSQDVLMSLRPVVWSSRLHEGDLGGNDDPDMRYVGFVAEEVMEVDERLGWRDADGEPLAINWNTITTLLVAEVQKLRKEVDLLKQAA